MEINVGYIVQLFSMGVFSGAALCFIPWALGAVIKSFRRVAGSDLERGE